jgi:hypothetical protein
VYPYTTVSGVRVMIVCVCMCACWLLFPGLLLCASILSPSFFVSNECCALFCSCACVCLYLFCFVFFCLCLCLCLCLYVCICVCVCVCVSNRLERAAGRKQEDISKLFKCVCEQRVECLQSSKVRYSTSTSIGISLPVPMEAGVDKVIEEAPAAAGVTEDDKQPSKKQKMEVR